jgi:poly(3-hydroxybutyrate) depolymerase
LPPLGANPDTITISGYSSGAFMAQAMTVIFSKTIKGCGEVGGGVYTFNWLMQKNASLPVVLDQALDATAAGVKNGTIDHPSNLEGMPFWILIEEVN